MKFEPKYWLDFDICQRGMNMMHQFLCVAMFGSTLLIVKLALRQACFPASAEKSIVSAPGM